MNGNEKKTNGLSKKELALLIFNFLWMVALYYGCVAMGEKMGTVLPYQICTGIYASLAIILPAVSCVLSGKFVSKRTGEDRTPEQIALSKSLMLWAIPLIAVLLIDITDLYVVEYLRKTVSVAVGR